MLFATLRPTLRAATRTATGLLLLSLVAGPTDARPQDPPGAALEIGPGRLADPVPVAAAPDASYALYLPRGYDPQRSWPVLFLLDSEGRGAALVERFRAAADRHGYVLVSSNDTAHDTPWEINQRLVRLLLADSFRHARVDSARLGFAGFSGTARLAWSAGEGFRDAVEGVILMGGTTPGSRPPDNPLPFPVFATTGREDFNHDEVRRLMEILDRQGTDHRLRIFDGGNEWPPPRLTDDALGWLRLQAMARGKEEVEPGLVRERLADELARMQSLEANGEPLAAQGVREGILRDFPPLLPEDDPRLTQLARELETAEKEAVVKRARKALKRSMADAEVYRADLLAAIRGLRRDVDPPQPNRMLSALKIPSLRQRADRGEPAEARQARRLLELAWVYTSYYLPPELMALGKYRHAASSLTVATAIHPEDPRVWLDLARAYGHAGERKETLEALERAVAASRQLAAEDSRWQPLEPADLADPAFAFLEGDEDLRALAGRLEASSSSTTQ